MGLHRVVVVNYLGGFCCVERVHGSCIVLTHVTIHCSSPYIFNGASPKLWDKGICSTQCTKHETSRVTAVLAMTKQKALE